MNREIFEQACFLERKIREITRIIDSGDTNESYFISYFPTELLEKQANERIEYLKDVLKELQKEFEAL